MKHRRWNVAIVGAGNVGLVFGRVLVNGGDRVVAVISRTVASAKRGGRFVGCKSVGIRYALIGDETDLILLTVPHAAVEASARMIADLPLRNFRHLTVCHTSGMHSATVLAPLAGRGATVFSFHPLQTFPRDFPPRRIVPTIPGIWYGIDGDERGMRAARRLAGRLGGRVVVVPPAMRILYHAACVVASNHLTALLGILEDLHRVIGMPSSTKGMALFRPIISTTLGNVAAASAAEALSGPVARGGIETIARHFESVQRFAPELIPYFGAMTEETVRLAKKKGVLDDAQVAAFRDLVNSYRAVERTEESST